MSGDDSPHDTSSIDQDTLARLDEHVDDNRAAYAAMADAEDVGRDDGRNVQTSRPVLGRIMQFNEKHDVTVEQQFLALTEELGELSETLNRRHTQGDVREEVADVLFVAASIGELYDIDPMAALRETCSENLQKDTETDGQKVTKSAEPTAGSSESSDDDDDPRGGGAAAAAVAPEAAVPADTTMAGHEAVQNDTQRGMNRNLRR